MDTKDVILNLRDGLQLSQDEFASRLFVTRQAVSRWENGDTVPNTDTLKLIAKTFQVSVDQLLGDPAGQCQSCGMALENDDHRGTERDGSKSWEYCSFCYRQGEFAEDLTMDQLIEHNLRDLKAWNQANNTRFTAEEARAGLREFLPTLKRWKSQPVCGTVK